MMVQSLDQIQDPPPQLSSTNCGQVSTRKGAVVSHGSSPDGNLFIGLSFLPRPPLKPEQALEAKLRLFPESELFPKV